MRELELVYTCSSSLQQSFEQPYIFLPFTLQLFLFLVLLQAMHMLPSHPNSKHCLILQPLELCYHDRLCFYAMLVGVAVQPSKNLQCRSSSCSVHDNINTGQMKEFMT